VNAAVQDREEFRVSADVLHDFEAACRLEWLETNGIGGLASSSVICANTRRYHSLLTVTTPTHGRLVLLNKLEDVLHVRGVAYPLSCNRYPGTVYPQGHLLLDEFQARPAPTWHFHLGPVRLTKRLALAQGADTVAVEYTLSGDAEAALLELHPLLSFRDHHSLTHENQDAALDLEVGGDELTVRLYPGLPVLRFAHFDAFGPVPDWYRHFEYAVEQYRGLDYREDLFCPGALTLRLKAGQRAGVVATIEEGDPPLAADIVAAEVERKQRLVSTSPVDAPLGRALTVAADQFVVRLHGKRTTILAGHHWFTDWGRDTMISLPGLCLATGRHREAREILAAFAGLCDGGMIPNRLPEADQAPDYNTVDASLWMFAAVHEFVQATGDLQFVREKLWDCLRSIIDGYRFGTRYRIHQDADGLVLAGEADTQLTWMDAKVGGWVVTPRPGKAVEICALWYNALRTNEDLAVRLGSVSLAGLGKQAEQTRAAFNEAFWNAGTGCLYDVIRNGERDPAIRPNQLLAISLPYPVLDEARWQSVLDVCERELLTPVGLRSLSPSDPAYRGHYGGDQWQRDGAYHQGTVWGWLLGPFLSAYLKVYRDAGRERARELLRGLEDHLHDAGLGTISEIFDGDPPHPPRGCVAQAWSVAEALRVLAELQ